MMTKRICDKLGHFEISGARKFFERLHAAAAYVQTSAAGAAEEAAAGEAEAPAEKPAAGDSDEDPNDTLEMAYFMGKFCAPEEEEEPAPLDDEVPERA